MIVFGAQIGSTGLYLLFVWLIASAGGAWASERKGYGDRVGLAFGLLLSAIGLVIVLLLPARPGSRWKIEGPLSPSARARLRRGGRSEPPRSDGPPPPAPDSPPPAV